MVVNAPVVLEARTVLVSANRDARGPLTSVWIVTVLPYRLAPTRPVSLTFLPLRSARTRLIARRPQVGGTELGVTGVAVAGGTTAAGLLEISTEPMSVPSEAFDGARSTVLTVLRCSIVSPLEVPLSIAGLVSAGSLVWVGPPLAPRAPSWGS